MSDQNWRFFKRDELQCRFTQECEMNEDFMQKVIILRERFDRPMRISSAFRHSTHPAERSKQKPGWHNAGRALDCLVSGTDAWQLVRYATEMGMSVGINQRSDIPHSKRFIHIDDRPAPQMIWSY